MELCYADFVSIGDTSSDRGVVYLPEQHFC